MMPTQNLDTFVCVHTNDIGDLLEMVLRSYMRNFRPKGRLILVSNDPVRLKDFLDRAELDVAATISADKDWLSRQELTLPGWYRQQVIKLRSYQLCESANFCGLGADTILLQPIEIEDLLENGEPILYYTTHALPNDHYWYERLRVRYTSRILHVKPKVSNRYVDFINDLFCFSRDTLTSLNQYLETIYGPNYFYTLLGALKNKSYHFGEQTIYGVFVLDYLHQPCPMRDTATGFEHQVRSERGLRRHKFDAKVLHVVNKKLDVGYIRSRIGAAL